MDHKDLEFFRNLLNQMLEEAQQKGDSTLEEMTDSNEVFADPADRATAESDRSFTLRIRDRERRLIRKIQSALQRIDDGTYGICDECGEETYPRKFWKNKIVGRGSGFDSLDGVPAALRAGSLQRGPHDGRHLHPYQSQFPSVRKNRLCG